MRHTAARRYSFDAPRATIVVVSEDGPITVLRNGDVVGSSSFG
jgi:DNA integrity scanning protein DisA with diadenylate cyclase activity